MKQFIANWSFAAKKWKNECSKFLRGVSLIWVPFWILKGKCQNKKWGPILHTPSYQMRGVQVFKTHSGIFGVDFKSTKFWTAHPLFVNCEQTKHPIFITSSLLWKYCHTLSEYIIIHAERTNIEWKLRKKLQKQAKIHSTLPWNVSLDSDICHCLIAESTAQVRC